MPVSSLSPDHPPQTPDEPSLLSSDERRSGPQLFARNRRDGARLLSSTLILCVIGLVGWSHPLGRSVALLAGGVSLFWWLQYRRLRQ